jgi:outer membrane lipoprotein LolB
VTRRLGALALIVLLGGCRTLPAPGVTGPDPAARAALAGLVDWHADGRVAVRSGSEGFSASFDWRESGGQGEVGVRGPFGAGAVHISRSAERIRIESSSAPALEVAAPFEALEPALTARLGFPLPLDSLRYWVLGVPAPGLASTDAADGFVQGGWTVAVAEYVAVRGAPAALPARLVLTRAATRIRVVVDRWQVAPP